jgi:hypothetical protein
MSISTSKTTAPMIQIAKHSKVLPQLSVVKSV